MASPRVLLGVLLLVAALYSVTATSTTHGRKRVSVAHIGRWLLGHHSDKFFSINPQDAEKPAFMIQKNGTLYAKKWVDRAKSSWSVSYPSKRVVRLGNWLVGYKDKKHFVINTVDAVDPQFMARADGVVFAGAKYEQAAPRFSHGDASPGLIVRIGKWLMGPRDPKHFVISHVDNGPEDSPQFLLTFDGSVYRGGDSKLRRGRALVSTSEMINLKKKVEKDAKDLPPNYIPVPYPSGGSNLNETELAAKVLAAIKPAIAREIKLDVATEVQADVRKEVTQQVIPAVQTQISQNLLQVNKAVRQVGDMIAKLPMKDRTGLVLDRMARLERLYRLAATRRDMELNQTRVDVTNAITLTNTHVEKVRKRMDDLTFVAARMVGAAQDAKFAAITSRVAVQRALNELKRKRAARAARAARAKVPGAIIKTRTLGGKKAAKINRKRAAKRARQESGVLSRIGYRIKQAKGGFFPGANPASKSGKKYNKKNNKKKSSKKVAKRKGQYKLVSDTKKSIVTVGKNINVKITVEKKDPLAKATPTKVPQSGNFELNSPSALLLKLAREHAKKVLRKAAREVQRIYQAAGKARNF